MPSKQQYYQRSWEINEPKAVVLLVHGLAEHTSRYENLGTHLNSHNYSLLAVDLPGHGRSSGTPGHINSFSEYHDAIRHLIKLAKQKHPEKELFLLGHSMGGLISAQFLLDHQNKFKGAMLSGPAIETPQEPPNWQVSVITLLSKIVPKLGVLKLDAKGISQDPAVVEQYMKDQLVYKGKLSARFLVEMANAMEDCISRANKIALPILIMHGGGDQITSPNGSQTLYKLVSSKDKTIKIYEGLFHEIFNEPDYEKIYSEVVNWLDAHT
ncbi:MAG: lysophospholipase [Acidiferrobacterales bacterium]|nr:lysophospholipase [Acidiferrobacterales bacterium]